MSGRAKIRWTVLVGLVALFAAGRAHAQAACDTDVDCPNPACGGEVCTKSSGLSSCNPANTFGGPGTDGWCAADGGVADDSKCKCRGMGAVCDGFYCTFTVPPTGTGGSGAGGSTGTGGSGGASGSAGSSGGASAGGGGGGCNVAGAPSLGGAAGLLLVLAAMIRRRARSSRTRG